MRPWAAPYLDIPLDKPAGGATPAGGSYDYRANDAAAADLDGDGQYEIVLKWDPSNSKDNSQGGYTGPAVFDAYELDGTRLWRIDLGRNVRAGAHYSPFLVADFDGDGRAEFVVRTADGTVDGAGTVIGDAAADHRTTNGRILSGPEYLTVFDGRTGAALATVDHEPARGNLADWGDTSGNRSDRFLAAAAYLDGARPSIVMTRGYYAKSMLTAYDWRDGELTRRWTFSSAGNAGYGGQGNHNLSVADVDGDGRDEIAYGAMTLDDDGTGLYTTKLEHGDAMHLGDLDPARPGLEIVSVHEHTDMPCGLEMHDAATGEILWCVRTGQDTGRGLTGDIDPAHPGEEVWASNGAGLRTAAGELISSTTPAISNTIWWDGDLSREILDHDYSADTSAGVPTIGKWDPAAQNTVNLLTATGTSSNNTTKGNPSLQADLLGDWREELLVRTEDSTALRLYGTPYPTEHRFTTLTHDPVYQSH
ncbi:rhamnogalacturonan lyase, partial [Nonomuraea sp. NPDC004297]